MSFEVMSREELFHALRKRGVCSKFIDRYTFDVTGGCQYHVVKDEVRAGCYTFEHFVAAHAELESSGKEYTLGEVRLLAQQSFVRAVQQRENQASLAWQDGLMC